MEGTGFLDAITRGDAVPDGLPAWLTDEDLDVYTDQFGTSGFFGPLSWYRNLDADYEITKDLPPPSVPSAFIGGTRDGVIAARLDTIDEGHAALPAYRGSILIEGAGHWTQQERPDEFNAALLELLTRVS
jgi:pimeloyl-ACP methyl ester carboxylesterase